jgi:hypothetical protein
MGRQEFLAETGTICESEAVSVWPDDSLIDLDIVAKF